MPELPEVETVRRELRQVLPGRRIKRAQVFRDRTIGFPEPERFCRHLPGHRILDVLRRGKYLLLPLDGGAMLVAHLGMSGRLLVRKPVSEKHLRAVVHFDEGPALYFHDPRVFGRLWYVESGIEIGAIIPGIGHMGSEPLEGLNVSLLQKRFARHKQVIKATLLNQSVVAGLGNIYADEVLFKAGIHPLKSTRLLSRREIKRLAEQIKEVLELAIAHGGTTIRNYTGTSGRNGRYQRGAWVYGRSGKPCRVCGCEIRKSVVTARSTHFCPRCQK